MKVSNDCRGELIVFLVLLIFSFPAIAADGFSKMLQQAKSTGSARVIVKLNLNTQIEGLLSKQTDVLSQRSRISNSQSDLLSQLNGVGQLRQVKQFQTIPYLAMEVDEKVLMALRNNPAVVEIEEDALARPTLLQSVPFINGDDVISDGHDGDGWAVAILDTGVRNTHVDLDNGKVVSEACYSSNDTFNQASTLCPNGFESQVGSGAGVNCSNLIDGCDHGTHVAGIAAGTYGGVAPGADIIAIQVFSRFDSSAICGIPPCVLSYTSDQILGLERVYALRDTYNIASVNMSLGGGQYFSHCDSNSTKTIIDNLRAAGIATVIASGNNGYNGALGAPSCISSAIAVGSTLDNSNTVSSFSNHANLVDMLAPGSNITSSVSDTTTSRASFNGTSMAAPHVAGAYAVLREFKLDATVIEIETALESTGVDVSRLGVTVPRIDLLAARNSLIPPAPGPDLIVQNMAVDDSEVTTGQMFTASATVNNQGTMAAAATTLRYYWSTDSSISTIDTELGTDAVGALNAGSTSDQSEQLFAPDFAPPYWIGACVDIVSSESNTGNNCSSGVQITGPNLLPVVSNPNPADGVTVVESISGQLLRVFAPEATSGVIHYDDDSVISFDTSATVNGDYLEATIPYAVAIMNNNGTNYWYVEATNAGGTTRYPSSGNLSFTVTPDTNIPLPVVSEPDPEDGSTVTEGVSRQLLRIKAVGATSGRIYYDDDAVIDFNALATLNGDYLEAMIPYDATTMNNDGINYWYVEATNSAGTIRYPISGNLSFTVKPLVDLDIYEPDGESGLASSIQSGLEQYHSIAPLGDEDWVEITLTRPSDVQIETRGETPHDTRAWLFNSTLNEIAFDNDGGEGLYSMIFIENLPVGIYYIVIDENGGNEEIPLYSLTVTYGEEEELCLPVKTKNDTYSVICL